MTEKGTFFLITWRCCDTYKATRRQGDVETAANGTEISRKSFQKFWKLFNFRNANHSTENSRFSGSKVEWRENLRENFFEILGIPRKASLFLEILKNAVAFAPFAPESCRKFEPDVSVEWKPLVETKMKNPSLVPGRFWIGHSWTLPWAVTSPRDTRRELKPITGKRVVSPALSHTSRGQRIKRERLRTRLEKPTACSRAFAASPLICAPARQNHQLRRHSTGLVLYTSIVVPQLSFPSHLWFIMPVKSSKIPPSFIHVG